MEHSRSVSMRPRSSGWAVCWAAIVACTVALPLIQSAARDASPEAGTATAKAVLTFQARILVAAETLSEDVFKSQRAALEGLAGTPEMTRRVAVVLAAVGGPEGAVRARELLGRPDAGEKGPGGDLVLRAIDDPTGLDPAERAALEEEHGWPAAWLLATALPEDDPVRRQLRSEAFRALAAVTVLGAGGVIALAVGIALLVTGAILWRQGRMTARARPTGRGEQPYLESFAVYLAGFTLSGAVFLWTSWGGAVARIAVVAGISLLAVAWPVLRSEPAASVRETLGLHRGAGFVREAGCGILAYVATVPVLAAALAASLWLQAMLARFDPETATRFPSHPILPWITEGGLASRLGALALAACMAPLLEEAMFRGAFLAGSMRTLGRAGAIVVMAAIFALVHPQGLVAVPGLVALAVAFGLMRVWRGSLVAGITAHAIHNGMLVAFVWLAMG